MADQKLTDLPAIATGDIDNSVLLYCVDVTGGNISSKVTRSALYLDIANTFTKGQTISPVTITGLTLNPPTTPVGSASVIFIGGISITTGTIAFATTAQSTDYGTVRINQSTLVNSPGSGTIPNAWSLKIDGPPIASTNVTISNNYALWIASGGIYFQGTVTINNGSSPLVIYNPAGSFTYTITPAAIVANRILNLPLITATDTLASLGLAQTFSALQTYSSGLTVSSGTATFASTTTTPVSITYPSAPAGSSSVFVGGINSPSNIIGFITTAQTGDYISRQIGIATLTNPSSGTITNASSLKILGSPVASTNVIITNAYALWIAGGVSRFDANVILASTTKLYLDGGTGVFLTSPSSGIMDFYSTTSNQRARIDDSLPTSHGIAHPAGMSQHSLTKRFEDGFNYSSTTGNVPTNGPYTQVNPTAHACTGTMLDGIDGGFLYTSGGVANFQRSGLMLNNIRNFNPALCTIYGIITCGDTTANLYCFAGISSDGDPVVGTDHSVVFGAFTNTNFVLTSSDGATLSSTSAGIALTTSKIQFKIVCTSSNLKLYTLVSGVWTLQVTKTSNRPTSACQPTFCVGNADTTVRTGSIQRLVVENDS